MSVRAEHRLFRDLRGALKTHWQQAAKNLDWLAAHLHPYFFITMKEETEAVVRLASGLQALRDNQQVVLTDTPGELILACQDTPGTVYRSLKELQHRVITYAEITHSYTPLPGSEKPLEIQRFLFGRKPHGEVAVALRSDQLAVPERTLRAVSRAMRRLYPEYDFAELRRVLRLLSLNNEHYVRISPPERIARLLWLYQQGRRSGGLFVDVENTEDVTHHRETRILFSVGNPPDRGFLAQVMEVFNRLGVSVRRAYGLDISTGVHPYFLGTFYATTRSGEIIHKDSDLFRQLQAELHNTQILAPAGKIYEDLVLERIMTGEEASLTNAMITFCHSNLAHNQPDRFDLGEVRRAFQANPEVALQLCKLFRLRFEPEVTEREGLYREALAETTRLVEGYNTGHRHLDEVRRTIFGTAVLFIRHTLKTNFFVQEKHALAFRLDPAYLEELGADLTADLPAGRPFRITFFYGRFGAGYHVGFSDIARGGWRTIICRSSDDLITNGNTVLREVYVLAHTQHLKNKDIYEGGSKMGVVLDASDLDEPDLVTQRLYKLQYGFINAFLDVFVTRDGRATHPRVVDYYREDEPIELGPDENMHDAMVELIAQLSQRRGYLLGGGIISSKEVGINHKDYGVTSLGVVRFAEIAMEHLGVDVRGEAFTVKITGGPNGDVAGNALKLLLERCPQVRIKLVVAGSGAAYDPEGLDKAELARLVLQRNIDEFDPARLNPGGCLLFRKGRRQEGLRELYRKVTRTAAGVEEQWVTTDEFHREYNGLVFEVDADLFLPAGGRPETIDIHNWNRMLGDGGEPSCRAIVEGANSFVTPAARVELQRNGVVVIRDASANKCGVISSSYEIIANLLMSDREFLDGKQRYVADVLAILEQRAADEARLIFRRRAEAGEEALFTEISDAISSEINGHYARLFEFFQARPALAQQEPYRTVLLNHLPAAIRTSRKFRMRVKHLPAKYQAAMIAVEIARSMVYRGDWETDFETALRDYARRLAG